MQIVLTKKTAQAMGIKCVEADENIDPLFCWIMKWTNTFINRKDDLIVMMNSATRFTVTIYGLKQSQLKNIDAVLPAAIKNTLLSMRLNPELVDDYISRMGSITYVANNDRKLTAQLNSQGFDAAYYIGGAINDSSPRIKFNDTWGGVISKKFVRSANEYTSPAKEMVKSLAALTGKPPYKYRAFELLATLDLEIYKATRRIIVPADIDFYALHNVLQKLFQWKHCHLFDFTVVSAKNKILARLVPYEDSLEYDKNAILMDGHTLSEYFPKCKHILYTYDMGDNWEHDIALMRVIEEHNEESPYLLEANGQTPPEDIGGVYGFIAFREIMLNPAHPNYAETKEWAGYWSPELSRWDSRLGVIDL